jgi:hypothetical protein
MDSDKIIVRTRVGWLIGKLHSVKKSNISNSKCLSDGCLMNIGRPYDLLRDTSSVLCKLTEKQSEQEQKALFDIAYKHAFGENTDFQ